MPKRVALVILAVALAATWNLEPVRSGRGWVWQVLHTGTSVVTGREALHVGQEIRRTQLRSTLDLALRDYRQMNGSDPQSLQDLVAAGVLQRADLTDEWGRPLRAEAGAQGLVIRGLGADGERATADDWTLGD